MTTRASKPAPPVLPVHRPSRRELMILLAALLPPLTLCILCTLQIPLGKPGTLTYLYSPIPAHRLRGALAAIPLAALAGCAIGLCGAESIARRRTGLLLAALCLVGLGTWSYLAPPEHIKQHVFNMQSPSHDGAFIYEAFQFDDVHAYLRDFPRRAATPPAEMKGTRVISNPPGTTLLAYAVRQSLGDQALDVLDVPDETADLRFFRVRAGVGLATLWILTVLWIASAVPLYVAGRLFAPQAPAAAFAMLSVASPMTLLFAPGKDVAQLFTLSLPLCLWLYAWHTGRRWSALLAGALVPLAAMVGLVHLWLAAISLVATLAVTRREDGSAHSPADPRTRPGPHRAAGLQLALFALLGASAASAALLTLGIDLPATLRAVARAQAEVTRGPGAMPLTWQLLGVPIFLLFCGPAVWLAVASAWLRDERPASPDARFGRLLARLTLLVMLATIGFTNMETPRLWIPFAPLLLLAALIRFCTEASRTGAPAAAPTSHRRQARLLGLLVFSQLAAGALQWSLMDMRETETRLVGDTPRFFR